MPCSLFCAAYRRFRASISKLRSRHRKERVCEFRSEGFQLGSAFGSGGEFVLFADEPVAVGLDGAGAEAPCDQIRRFAVELESARAVGGEERAAISFADADVLLVHRKTDDVETARA